MKVSDIDKDLVDVINQLNENGFKPFGSCDGVLANHKDPSTVTTAYISFLESPRILDLMAAFLRDKETFTICIADDSTNAPTELYGNIIQGMTYSVYFENKYAQASHYFERIVTQVVEGKIAIADEEKSTLMTLVQALEANGNTDLHFEVNLNGNYQPNMGKQGKINSLTIGTKCGYGYDRDMGRLAQIVTEKYGLVRKFDEDDEYREDEFVSSFIDKSRCEIFLTDEHIGQIPQLIKDIKEIGHNLPTFEVHEFDGDYEEFEGEYEKLLLESYGEESHRDNDLEI